MHKRSITIGSIAALLSVATLTACSTAPDTAPTVPPTTTTATPTAPAAPVPTTTTSTIETEEDVITDYVEPADPVALIVRLDGVTLPDGVSKGETTPEGDRTVKGYVMNENGNQSVLVDVLTFPENVPTEIAFPEAVHPEPSDMETYITGKGFIIPVVDPTMTTATPAMLSSWAAAVDGTVSE